MFGGSAQWYDAIYSFKNYQQESEKIVALLKKEHPRATSLLDIACGTAEHHRYLPQSYSVDGIDLNQEFIEIAPQKNPAGQFFQADMADFDLKQKYDAVLCLFSSIGYVKTLENVVKTLRCFKKHLNPEGIVVVEPWFTPEYYRTDGGAHLVTAENEFGKICRMNISEREGRLSIINFHYLVGTSDGVQHFTERHELGLFSIEEMKNAFKSAGLSVSFDEEGLTGRGLYIARLKH